MTKRQRNLNEFYACTILQNRLKMWKGPPVEIIQLLVCVFLARDQRELH